MPLITLLGDKRVRQHVVDEKHQQSCLVCCQSQYCGPIGNQMYIRHLRSSTPLWIIYLCAMGMSQNMLDLL